MLLSLKCRRLNPFLSRSRRYSSHVPESASKKAIELASIIREVESLGRKTQFRDIFFLVDCLPVHALVKAAIYDSKQGHRPSERYDIKVSTKPGAFSYIFNAFTLMKSRKLEVMIEYSKTDMLLADSIGSKALYDACAVLNNIQSAVRKRQSPSEATSDVASCAKERLHSLKNLHSTENIFVMHYTQWLLHMSGAQRFHHTVNIMCHSNVNRYSYYLSQLQHLHDELSFLGRLEKQNTKPDYTILGDVALASFTAANMSSLPDLALGRIKHPLVNVNHVSKDAFSLAVSACVSGKKFTDISKKGGHSIPSLNHLLTICYGNTFQCIVLRNILLQILLTRGLNTLVVEYFYEFRKKGLLIDTRGCNCVASALIKLRDFNNAMQVLDFIEFEEGFVRRQGPRIFSDGPLGMSIEEYERRLAHNDTPDYRADGSNGLTINDMQGVEEGDGRGSGVGGETAIDEGVDGTESAVPKIQNSAHSKFFDINGNSFQNVFSNRRKKYNVVTVGKIREYETEGSGSGNIVTDSTYDSIADSIEEGSDEGDSERILPSIDSKIDQELEILLQNNVHEIPLFGANLHSFLALIFSPYLNIESRDYYSDNKYNLNSEGDPTHVFFTKFQVATILTTLLNRMARFRVQPDHRFLSKVLLIGKNTGSNNIIFRVLNLAKIFYITRDSWSNDETLLQPHTMSDTAINVPRRGNYQVSELFCRQSVLEPLTSINMSNFFETAVEAKMKHNDIQMCEFLLHEMVSLRLAPTPLTTKLIMGYYLRTRRYSDVLHIFEMMPRWGGDRTFVHGSMVILSLTNMGLVADAWRGTEMLQKDGKYLNHDATEALFLAIAASVDSSKHHALTSSGKKKLSKRTQLHALSTLALSLLRHHHLAQDQLLKDKTRVLITEVIMSLSASDHDMADTVLAGLETKSVKADLPAAVSWVQDLREKVMLAGQDPEPELKSASIPVAEAQSDKLALERIVIGKMTQSLEKAM